MGMFGGVEAARAQFEQNYIKPGHYLMRIDKVKAGQNWKQEDYVAVEMTVLHAYDDGEGSIESWHKPGEAVSDIMSRANPEMFLGKVKTFVARTMHQNTDDITEQVCEAVTGAAQPLVGLVVELRAVSKTTKKRGITITVPSYVGQVPAIRVAETIDPGILAKEFPGEALDNLSKKQASFGIGV